jgi:putative aldouronate transport system permease protein
MIKRKTMPLGKIINHTILIAMSLTYILPLIMMISISFSSESEVLRNGYSIFPQRFTTVAYETIFSNPKQIIQGYKVTALFSIVKVILSILITALMAYPLARKNFIHKKFVTVYLMITLFFSGGLVPSYIMNTQYLHLGNSIWIYILPGLVSAWNVILFKTYFKSLPEELIEAARIDGARETRILFTIIIPLSTPIIGYTAFTMLLASWNSWQTSMLYIRDTDLYSLQYLLQRIINESNFIKEMAKNGLDVSLVEEGIPSETLKFAMAVIASGPMLCVFPFFQKYFAKGIVVGSVKG